MADFIIYNEDYSIATGLLRAVPSKAAPVSYDMLVTLEDIATKQHYNYRLSFFKPPTEQEIIDAVEKRIYLIQNPPVDPEEEVVMTISEVEQLLISKEFLVDGQTIADLKTKTELLTAEVIKEVSK